MRESLGTIMASFTYIYDSYAIIKEIDIIMSFESAMLDVQGKWMADQWGKDGIWVAVPLPKKPSDYITPIPRPQQQIPEQERKRVVRNYKELFDVFRGWWEIAVSGWNSTTGSWKDSIIICSKLRADLMRIALKEGLVSLTSSMYTINIPDLPQPIGDQFFVDE